ncbi:MAG: (2Fe-2S)-binding protein [Pirellulales bacterium]|nr:(2Fe-2S)-binding protein [Pirellulales bacterium]
MPTVNFVNEKKQIEVPQGANLRKEARKHGIQLYKFPDNYLHCRGLGACGTCRVLIPKGIENTGKKSAVEKLRMKMSLAAIGHEDEMRLSCQTKVEGDIDVITQPPMNLYGENFFS